MKTKSVPSEFSLPLFSLYVSLVLFSIVGSTVSIRFNLNPGLIAPLAGFFLILSGASCIAVEIGDLRTCLSVIVVSVVAEVAGLWTGLPFGRYEYTGKWWPSVMIGGGHSFPVLLPFAWVMIVGGSYLVISPFAKGWAALVGTALLSTLIDAPMERAMTDAFGYWKWMDKGPVFGAPILNSFGWILTSLLAATTIRANSKLARSLYAPQVLGLFCFFAAISGYLRSVDLAWLLLACLGLGLCALRFRQRNPRI